MKTSETPLMDELRAILCVRCAHGDLEQVARVADICPRRLSNCLNPDQPHKLGLDEGINVVQAGLELGLPGAGAFADHIITKLQPRKRPARRRNGSWMDELAGVLCESSALVKEHGHTPDVRSLSLRDAEEIRGALLRCRDLIDGGLKELEQ